MGSLALKQRMLMSILLLSTSLLYAKDPVLTHKGKNLGVMGQTYPIQEMDFLQFIYQRLEGLSQSGDLKKLQTRWVENVKQHTDRPTPLRLINKTITPKRWEMTPAITVPYDLRDHEGRIFVRAGTVVNPLQWVTVHKPMLFFDGDDETQVRWAKAYDQRLQHQTKLVLVKGSISEQTKIFHQPIYFDQAGKLTTRFHIEHVPAMVTQEGLHLIISEVLP